MHHRRTPPIFFVTDAREDNTKMDSRESVFTQNDYNVNGLAGLLELAQFSYLPIGLILKYSIGRLIAIRNIYEMLRRDFVIPDNNNNVRTYEH